MTTAGIITATLVIVVAVLLYVAIHISGVNDELPAMLDTTDEEDPR